MKKAIKQIETGLNKIAISFLWLIVPWIVLAILYAIISSFTDETYDNCMKKCVLPDKSNYNECSLSTCDFPI